MFGILCADLVVEANGDSELSGKTTWYLARRDEAAIGLFTHTLLELASNVIKEVRGVWDERAGRGHRVLYRKTGALIRLGEQIQAVILSALMNKKFCPE